MPLTLICGPMFAGKTRSLIERVRGAAAAGRDAVAAKPHVDTRFGSHELASHDGARYPAVMVSSASELRAAASAADVLGVDEAQFLSLELVDVLHELAARTEVVAAGLDLDFRGQPFPATALLAEFSDRVDRLTSTCTRCGGYATMTQRWVDGAPAELDDSVILLGGPGVYEPRCPTCFSAERSAVRVD
jgi:thymidine kinase